MFGLKVELVINNEGKQDGIMDCVGFLQLDFVSCKQTIAKIDQGKIRQHLVGVNYVSIQNTVTRDDTPNVLLMYEDIFCLCIIMYN